MGDLERKEIKGLVHKVNSALNGFFIISPQIDKSLRRLVYGHEKITDLPVKLWQIDHIDLQEARLVSLKLFCFFPFPLGTLLMTSFTKSL